MARRRTRSRTRPTPRPRPRRKSSAGRWVGWLAVLVLAGGLGWVGWLSVRVPWQDAASEPSEAAGASDLVLPAPPEFVDPDPALPPVAEAGVPPATSAPPGRVEAPRGTATVPGPASPSSLPGAGPGTNAGAAAAGTGVPAGWDNGGKTAGPKVVSMQLALARRGISSGPVDGVLGAQTQSALRVFQRREGLPATGQPDAATVRRLGVEEETPLGTTTVTAEDLRRIGPVPRTWLGKSSRERLDYESVLELVAERAHAHPRLVRQLNPGIDWARVAPGTVVRVPATVLPTPRGRAAFVRISLGDKALRAYDGQSNLLAHFPCSIARKVEKRPVGVLRVIRLAPNPNYRFDPEIFPESEEARKIGRKLMIPPGPNNPVGTAWIGLDKPGYGIHGTPQPEEVGRTESHGCFRLANWNAEYLLKLAWVGMPVYVEP